MTKSRLTQKRLKEVLHYDPETGIFTWLIANSHRVNIGDVAGCLGQGYIKINIDCRSYLAHRLAFFFMTGTWPADQVDHDNHVRNDNRWQNLNQATNATNHKNRSMTSKNTSGFVGVFWNKQRNKWMAQSRINGKQKYLGLFIDKADAIVARKAADIEYGYHVNHGLKSREIKPENEKIKK